MSLRWRRLRQGARFNEGLHADIQVPAEPDHEVDKSAVAAIEAECKSMVMHLKNTTLLS